MHASILVLITISIIVLNITERRAARQMAPGLEVPAASRPTQWHPLASHAPRVLERAASTPASPSARHALLLSPEIGNGIISRRAERGITIAANMVRGSSSLLCMLYVVLERGGMRAREQCTLPEGRGGRVGVRRPGVSLPTSVITPFRFPVPFPP